MKFKLPILLSFLLISTCELHAHAIWIETNPVAKKGQPHTAKVFLGEYANNERDSISNWFSNMKDFTLWLVTPGGQQQQLPVKPNVNHFTADFIPAEDGAYTLFISHEVADVYGSAKIQYYALATATVGDTKKGQNNIENASAFTVQNKTGISGKRNAPVSIEARFNKAPLASEKVAIASPEGWEKTVFTDTKGQTKFTPVWQGRYLLEGFYSEAKPGSHNGKTYKSVTHIVTNCVTIN